MQSLIKEQMGVKPTTENRAYTTRIAIANEKFAFFKIIRILPCARKIRALLVGNPADSGNNARSNRMAAFRQVHRS